MTIVQHIDEFNLASTQSKLMEDLKEAQSKLKDFNSYLENRYIDKAKEKLRNEGKDFGTVSVFEGNSKVKIELRKKVEWDQERLTEFLNTLDREESNHLVKVSVSIPESKFTNAMPSMQEKLKEFRTISLQGVKVTFEEKE